jgi:hypothetical protein
MSAAAPARKYSPTESKYKGGAREMYVTYDLDQRTRGGGTALYPKVKRVYIAGDVKDWQVGRFKKRTGREVYGVKIEYEQTRTAARRTGYTGRRGETTYAVSPSRMPAGKTTFTQIVEVPDKAENVRFHERELPPTYKRAIQSIR